MATVVFFTTFTITGILNMQVAYADSDLHGVLRIPDVGISVTVYDAHGNSQEIVDAEDSAAFLTWRYQSAIADHRGQDFDTLPNVVPGETIAYIDSSAETQGFICTQVQEGAIVPTETGRTVVDETGNYIGNQNEGGLCMYTCCIDQPDAGICHIVLTYWQPVEI